MQCVQFKRCEIVLHSTKEYANPFAEADIDAVFTFEDGSQISLPGFWNGGDEWKVRFSGEKAGKYTYVITCTDPDNASLTAKGEIEVLPCKDPQTELEKHGYVRLEPGKPYMVYGDGTPFFWLGDTHWQMPDFERLHECNYPGCTCGNQFLHLLKDRVKKGFTVYQTYFDSAESDGGGNKRVHHWWSEKYTRINPRAFNESMDIMMEELASRGMTVALGLGVHCSTTRAMGFKAEPLLKFARYCVARYACYPLVWITAQEITNETENTFEIWKQVGALVGRLDGYHRPNGAHMHAHPAQDPRSIALNKEPWHQWWTLQAGHGDTTRLMHRFFYRDYGAMPGNKMYIETECHYEDLRCSMDACSSDASRYGAYLAMQSGSAGFTYGVTGVWAMAWNQVDDIGWTGYSPEPWFIGMDKHGSTEMTYMKQFYETVRWWELEPGFGYEFAAFESRKEAAIAHRGQDTVIYYLYDNTLEVGLMTGLKKNTTYQMRFFDTLHNKYIDLPSFSTPDGSYPAPKKPSRRDWILLVTTEDFGPYETETYPAETRTYAPQDLHPGKEIPVAGMTASSCKADHPACAMIDGDPNTYWESFSPVTGQTLVADLGEKKDIGFIGMFSHMEKPQLINYRIYGSDDGESYTLLSERLGSKVGIGGQYDTFYDPLPASARYIKIFFNARNGGDALGFAKLAFYEKG